MSTAIERGELASLVAPLMEPLASALEAFGVAVIIIGVIFATVRYVRDLAAGLGDLAYDRYRANLGRGILLGLELLIGADIIATITSPLTWESVGLLGLIVLIRTFLSFSLEAEIEGEWPWQRQRRNRAAGPKGPND
ncbi:MULTISPECIES: DUF1622 domain-containing protein [unclassified Sinorhizobium]|uniref:DUF1622 domain-containing protein n=1 Tax=unclassified Sinorhizobium TaxID=2613772 RepID=UPI0024C3D402|nr:MULTISPECIES: DUF1622 domain-containing protein [unclassified Sinorhizobium]MDK1373877.1 DUF1622 domain-containing protein [Sinorhizobium sp. 6-70]MDK1481101.1 DUF1622 domain-containing protein [Sinorhizobium sp. 6-117]